MAAPVGESYTCASGGSVRAGKYAAVSALAKYKIDAEALFYDAPLGAAVSGGLAYTLGRPSVASPRGSHLWAVAGPHKDYVERYSQWKWLNAGGDWVDATGAAQGTAAAWVFNANAVSTGEYTYAVNMTAALQQVYARNTWNAWIIKCAQNRTWATRHNAKPPSLFVTYTDGSSESLACLASSGLYSGSAYTYVGIPTALFWGNNGVLEFARPRKPVATASMNFTITAHIVGAATVSGFLCNPPKNPKVVTQGLAAGYLLDDGIAADPNVWFSQRHLDGTILSDYILQDNLTHNHGYMSEWSPHMFSAVAANTNKLPYSWNGLSLTNKFLHGGRGTVPPTIVPSTYTGEGFTPAAPGVGALKVVIPGNNAVDGAVVGSAGSLGADMWAFLPEAESGLLDDMYVRFKVMYAPYPRQSVDQTKMFRSNSGSTAEYMFPMGKTGIGPHHWTDFGGNNRAGGGNLGHSSRGAYRAPMDMDSDSIFFGWHSLDMWYGTDPAGTQGGQVWAGQQNGIGTRLKRGVWYDIEMRVKLNTWNTTWDTAPSSDGIFQLWIDGILAIDFRNFTYRQGSLNYTNPADVNAALHRGYTPTSGTYRPPFRELGHVGIWLNDYQGGVISCEYDQTIFYSHIVAAKTRIGPVNTQPVLPINLVGNVWTPNRNPDLTIANTDWEQLPLNTWVYPNTPAMNSVFELPAYLNQGGSPGSANITNAWCGAAYNYVAQKMYCFGGGHGDTSAAETGIYELDFAKLNWIRVRDRDPKSEVGYWNASMVFNPVEAWKGGLPMLSGQPSALHTYQAYLWVPPEVINTIEGWSGNTSGGLYVPGPCKVIFNLDTKTYSPPHFSSGDQPDWSNAAAVLDGAKVYGPHAYYNVWRWDLTQRSASLWSADSLGFWTKNYASQGLAILSNSIWSALRERREYFGFYAYSGLTKFRIRYGAAIDAGQTNWGSYSDNITLTSSDGSHADFNNANLQDAGHLFAAGVAYDHATETMYIVSSVVGKEIYRVTGLSTNTWTTEKLAGTGVLLTSVNGTFGRLQLATLGGKKVLVRVSSTIHRPQVMRIS